MKPKKSPKADLNRKSSLFFVIGLVFALGLAYIGINWKTYEKEKLKTGTVNMSLLQEDSAPITVVKKKPPPPPPPPPPKQKTPEIVKVVENDAEVEELILKSTETSQSEAMDIVEVKEVAAPVVEEEIAKVTFKAIQNPPVYPGCEKYSSNKKKQKECMSAKIQEFVTDHFDTSLAQDLGLSGVNRIQVLFVIDSKGNVVNVRARAPHPRLKKEAIQVVKSLPKMKPGKQRGKPVKVQYSLPIIFRVQD